MALSEFGKAFAAARKAGDKTFEFKGKKYTTKMASETEQPSVGGKAKPGEYKTRAPYSDRGRTMLEDNYVRRDMPAVDERIDRESQGDAMAMKYVPRRTPEALTGTDKPGTATRYENEDATSETFKKGGSVRGWGKARGARKAKVY
jgi:hypothetical protein